MNDAFSAMLDRDLQNVFLNIDQFADLHKINDTNGIPCIVDSEMTGALHSGLSAYGGEFKNIVLLFVHVSDFPQGQQAAYHQVIRLDDVMYTIQHVDEQGDLYEIMLEAKK